MAFKRRSADHGLITGWVKTGGSGVNGMYGEIVSAGLSTVAAGGAAFIARRVIDKCQSYVDRVAAPALLGVSPLGLAPAAAATLPAPAGHNRAFQASSVADWMADAPAVDSYRRELAVAMREQASSGGDVYLGPTDAEIAADALDGF